MDLNKAQMLEIVKDCKVYVPEKTRLSYKELIEQAFAKNYIDIRKISDLSFYFLFDYIKKSLQVGDCYGKLFLEKNKQCSICQLASYCKILSNLPEKEEICKNSDSYKIIGKKPTTRNRLKRKIFSHSKTKKFAHVCYDTFEEVMDRRDGYIEKILHFQREVTKDIKKLLKD